MCLEVGLNKYLKRIASLEFLRQRGDPHLQIAE
jgi:hypothetical protein